MAEFIIKCPHCNNDLQIQDEWIGMEVECPICHNKFVIAAPTAVSNSKKTSNAGKNKKIILISAIITVVGVVTITAIGLSSCGDNEKKAATPASPELQLETSTETKVATTVKKELRIAREQGIKFSDDNKTLIECPKNIQEVIVPSCVTSIKQFAFSGCRELKKVTIPNSVTSIGSFAFNDCRSLKEIKLPSKITIIEEATFSNCSNLCDISIPDGVTEIKGGAFMGCKNLMEITIPDSVVKLADTALGDCPLVRISIPADLPINTNYFSRLCKIERRSVPSQNVEYIKIDMSSPAAARDSYKKAINSLSDKEVLEFALTWWFELNKVIPEKHPDGAAFKVAIELWHGKSLQERITAVKQKYGDEFQKKYTRNMERVGKKITPEMIQNQKRGMIQYFAQKFVDENTNKTEKNSWDNSGKIYFR